MKMKWVGKSKGQALVEFAVILPFLLVLIGGAVDYGLAFLVSNVVQNAARDGARVGATIPTLDPSDADVVGTFPECLGDADVVIQAACSRITNSSLFNGFTVSNQGLSGTSPNQGVTVAVSGTYRWFVLDLITAPLPLLGIDGFPDEITIARSAKIRWEWQ